MLRIAVILLIVSSSSIPVSAEEPDLVFVPHTPFSERELEQQKLALIEERGVDESTAEELIRRIPELRIRYTEEDIRRAFSGIAPGDERVSLCSNSVMNDETRLIYVSPKSEQTVTVKSSTCYPTENGLLCAPLSQFERYFFESPEHRFSLSDNVSIEEAYEVLEIFRDGGIVGLPDWHRRAEFEYRDVYYIDKVGIWYVLYLGDHYCRGCTAIYKVVIDAPGDRQPTLVLDAEPGGMCI